MQAARKNYPRKCILGSDFCRAVRGALAILAGVSIFYALDIPQSKGGPMLSEGHREALHRGCQNKVKYSEYRSVSECRRTEQHKFLSERKLVDLDKLPKVQRRKFKIICLKSMSSGIFPYDDCINSELVRLGLKKPGVKSAERERDSKKIVPPETSSQPPRNVRPSQGRVLRALNRAELVSFSERGTVFILTTKNGSVLSTGSGFFISPSVIVTNKHVIEDVSGPVFIINRSLGLVHKAEVVASSAGSTIGSSDFAILSLSRKMSSSNTFAVTPDAAKLAEVIALGYPGAIIRHNEAYHRLLKGDKSAAPDLVITSGEISAIQTNTQGIKTIAHTARINSGSSGGPLLDRCGRVVGVNTFGDPMKSTNFALSGTELVNFLRRHGISAQVDRRPCQNRM